MLTIRGDEFDDPRLAADPARIARRRSAYDEFEENTDPAFASMSPAAYGAARSADGTTSMAIPLTVRPPTRAEVLEAVRRALADGPDEYGPLPDFLASVDWSERVRPRSGVADLLGRLELWDSEYREGGIGWNELAARLATLGDE